VTAAPATEAGTFVGYVRASSGRMLEEELRTLADADCERIFSDTMVGRTARRPELQACLASLRSGDVLVVPTLSGLAHSIHDLIGLVSSLVTRGAGLRSMDGAVDTTGPDGQTVIELFTVLQRFVRDAYTDAARDGGVAAARSGQRRRGRRG
jgi:DNA invertase Pin-like site-specific DNA recombinase